MKYVKPALVNVAPAINAVQDPQEKPGSESTDNGVPFSKGTMNAYAADE